MVKYKSNYHATKDLREGVLDSEATFISVGTPSDEEGIDLTFVKQAAEQIGKAIQEKEKSFNEKVRVYENKRVNLIQISNYFTSMPPASAVGILLQMDDQNIIDIFNITNEEAVRAGPLTYMEMVQTLYYPVNLS